MKIVWNMTFETYNDYLEIFRALQAATEDQDHMRFAEQLDALQSLPGFPTNVDPDHDIVVPRIVTDTGLLNRVLH